MVHHKHWLSELCIRQSDLSCVSRLCQVFSDTFSSPRAHADLVMGPFEVNERFVLFLREIGLGYATLKKCCAVFGIKPM